MKLHKGVEQVDSHKIKAEEQKGKKVKRLNTVMRLKVEQERQQMMQPMRDITQTQKQEDQEKQKKRVKRQEIKPLNA